MKRSRKVGLIVGIIIFAIALVSVYIVYSRQAGERNNLNARLSAAQAQSNVLTKQKQDLEAELAQAQSLLSTSQAQFPEAVPSIEYGEDLYALADECEVELTRLTASSPTSKTVGAITYSVSSFIVDVSGNIDNILKFIDALRTGEGFQLPWSAEVAGISIYGGSSTIISLNIYGYRR